MEKSVSISYKASLRLIHSNRNTYRHWFQQKPMIIGCPTGLLGSQPGSVAALLWQISHSQSLMCSMEMLERPWRRVGRYSGWAGIPLIRWPISRLHCWSDSQMALWWACPLGLLTSLTPKEWSPVLHVTRSTGPHGPDFNLTLTASLQIPLGNRQCHVPKEKLVCGPNNTVLPLFSLMKTFRPLQAESLYTGAITKTENFPQREKHKTTKFISYMIVI